MLCFNEDRDYSRLLMEATFHHSHRDALQRIARSDVLEGRLTDVVNSEVGEHLSFSSLIEIKDMGIRHIPLLDFHCPESCTNDRVVSRSSRQLFGLNPAAIFWRILPRILVFRLLTKPRFVIFLRGPAFRSHC